MALIDPKDAYPASFSFGRMEVREIMTTSAFSSEEVKKIKEIVGERSIAINMDVVGTLIPKSSSGVLVIGCTHVEADVK